MKRPESAMSSKNTNEFSQKFNNLLEIESNTKYRQRIKDRLFGDEVNYDRIANFSDFDTEEKSVHLSLMEELCLIALGEEKAQISLLNDNMPYVLRCCILLELTLAHRIKSNIYKSGASSESRKLDVIITDFTPTGDVFLDEAIKILAKNTFDLQKWLDVLTGETWDRKLSSCQMYNLRDRVCKSLMEKGIVKSQKSTLFLVEITEYPLLNHNLKRNLCFKLIDSASDSQKLELRSLCRLLSVNAARIMSKALKITDAPTSSQVKAFAAGALAKYSQYQHLEASFGHLLAEGELQLLTGIFSIYAKINKFF